MSDDTISMELHKLKESEKHFRILLDESMDPTFSFYPDGTYRYVNKAFADGLNKTPEQIIGFKIWDIFDKKEADLRFSLVKKVFAEGKTTEIEVRVPLEANDTYYLTTVKPIVDGQGNVETVICTSKNITKRKVAEIELKKAHDDLLLAMEEIQTLTGFIPICSSCKSIRDDEGYWSKIEAYLSKYADVELTHSLCPHCVEKLYGNAEWYKKKITTLQNG